MRKIIFFIFYIIFFVSFSKQIYAGCDDGVSVYHYGDITGCGCFSHCSCFSHYISERIPGGFPNDDIFHPFYPEDKIWHEFMKKFLTAIGAAPYFPSDRSSIRHMVEAQDEYRFICLLSEYLNAIKKLEKKIEITKLETIDRYKKIYQDPKDYDKLQNNIKITLDKTNKAFQILSSIPETIIPIYKTLIQSCPHTKSYNMALVYNRGLAALLEGNIDVSLSDINSIIDFAVSNGHEAFLNSQIFQKQGEAYFEVGLFNQAIESLTKAIVKDPSNLEAYFQRASAYFETGDFEKSIEDYITSKKRDAFVLYKLPPNDFVESFSKAAINGACEAACDFIPSLCNTVYGLGECLWVFGEHPVDSIQDLACTGYEIGEHLFEFLKTLNKEQMNEYAVELVNIYDNFSNLTDKEKGDLIGHLLGKYGVDIFAGSVAIKGIAAFQKMKEANRICNLESLIISGKSREAVVSKALQQYSERTSFFENSYIHWDKQNKHVPGMHNYQEGKSIFEHPNAENLLRMRAGKGTPKRGEMGKPGYQEVVDFNEHIGVWRNKVESLTTTKGTIHYSKDGAHIVPEHPDAKLW